MDFISPSHWGYVSGTENPADCASRGLFPTDILTHNLWWEGPPWLKNTPSEWPVNSSQEVNLSSEHLELCSFVTTTTLDIVPIISVDKFSSFGHYKRITAWAIRFIENCLARKRNINRTTGPLLMQELDKARNYWISVIQGTYFHKEIEVLKTKREHHLKAH